MASTADIDRTFKDLLDALSNEAKKEPISPDRVAALSQAISALSPKVGVSD